MRSEDVHVRETGRGPCYGSSNTEHWGAMNAIMLLQVFLQMFKKQWAMRLECLVLIIACLCAGLSRWVNTHDYAVNDLKRMFAVCLVCERKKIVCHKCRGMLSNLKSSRENYAVCSLLLKLKDSYLTSFPSHVFVFYTDICFINTNLFFQTRTCLPLYHSQGARPFNCVLCYEITWRKVGRSACLVGQGKEYCVEGCVLQT